MKDWAVDQPQSLDTDRDCLVVKLASDVKGEVLKRPRKAPSKSFFPSRVVSDLRLVMEDDRGLLHNFGFMCEIFLRMYLMIFGRLQYYALHGGSAWRRRPHPQVPSVQEEFKELSVKFNIKLQLVDIVAGIY